MNSQPSIRFLNEFLVRHQSLASCKIVRYLKGLPTLLAAIAIVSVPTLQTSAQDDPDTKWGEAIERFEKADQEQAPAKGQILFVGSSSIRLWDLEKHFANFETINRGFGGSQISEVNHFIDRIVLKYEPSIIVFYAGDNDIAKGKSADQVFADFEVFLERVSAELPETQVVFVPIKPSRSRWELWPEMSAANQRIREFMALDYRWHYADTASPMLTSNEPPSAELFVDDGLHLNEEGYALWSRIVEEKLIVARKVQEQVIATGIVYEDKNKNRRFDSMDSPMSGVRVSNGESIVKTDAKGQYEIPVSEDDIVFVIKPRGYRTPLSRNRLPEFYYIHKPEGSPPSRFAGVEPTGPLPDSIDFPLYPQPEPETFKAIFFGDPQPRDQKEVDFVLRDVVEELVGTDASFGVTLGDIMFDNLSLFESQNQGIAVLGIPWYNVIGNHDLNRDAPNDKLSDETFEKHFGPSYYSFDYGPTHFIVIDDVEHLIDVETGRVGYRGGLGAEQLSFIREDLAGIPHDQLVVLMMHIPLPGVQDRHSLYRLIEQRPFSMSISGHTHHHEHRFIDESDDWRGETPHHHVINVTVSGSWWSGRTDERGIPHTTMADGAPNGYSQITFDGHDYEIDYKVAGRSAEYQMRITCPIEIEHGKLGETEVYVNVFNGSSRSKVEMKWANSDAWSAMTYAPELDPYYKELVQSENIQGEKSWRNLPNPKRSPHLWKANLTSPGDPGTYLLEVRETDYRGRVTTSQKLIRITGPSEQ